MPRDKGTSDVELEGALTFTDTVLTYGYVQWRSPRGTGSGGRTPKAVRDWYITREFARIAVDADAQLRDAGQILRDQPDIRDAVVSTREQLFRVLDKAAACRSLRAELQLRPDFEAVAGEAATLHTAAQEFHQQLDRLATARRQSPLMTGLADPNTVRHGLRVDAAMRALAHETDVARGAVDAIAELETALAPHQVSAPSVAGGSQPLSPGAATGIPGEAAGRRSLGQRLDAALDRWFPRERVSTPGGHPQRREGS